MSIKSTWNQQEIWKNIELRIPSISKKNKKNMKKAPRGLEITI